MIPRGLRLKNPGNIEHSGIPWKGEIPGTDPRFITFDTMVNGICAMAKVLKNYDALHGLDTVRGIITRWAPPSENNTEAYIDDVCAHGKVKPDTVLDLTNPSVLSWLIYGIICHENGPDLAARYVSASDLHDGIAAA